MIKTRPWRIVRAVLTAAILSVFLCTHIYALDRQVFDRADIISQNDKEKIEDAIRACMKESDFDFYVVTHSCKINENSSYNPDIYTGEDFMYENGLSLLDDVIILIITYDYEDDIYYYDMYTYGDAYHAVSQTEADRILDSDSVYPQIKSGNLTGGSIAFVELSSAAATGHLHAPWGKIILISAVLAAITAVICCLVIIGKYKMKIKATNYPLDRFCRLNLTDKADIYTGTFVTRRKISTSGSSGGRGGSRSRSGGGRGHRGGR